MSNILSALQGLQYGLPAIGPSGSFESINQATVDEASVQVAGAQVSLNANLNQVTASTGTGQLALAFAQALQSATEVDPATGHLEIIAGANAQLSSALNTLLVQNGFSSDAASAATASFASDLAQGGTAVLSAGYDVATQATGSVSSNYGSGSASSASAIDSTDRSGLISIGVNLDTGELKIALDATTSSSYATTSIVTGPDAQAAPLDQPWLQPSDTASSGIGASAAPPYFGGILNTAISTSSTAVTALEIATAQSSPQTAQSNAPLVEVEDDYVEFQASASASLTDVQQNTATSAAQNPSVAGPNTGAVAQQASATLQYVVFTSTTSFDSSTASSNSDSALGASGSVSILQQLLAELNHTELVAQQELRESLKKLSGIAAQAHATGAHLQSNLRGHNAAEASASTAPIADKGSAPSDSQTVSVQIGITQTLSVQQLDTRGYGVTLFKRPDGDLGKITTHPTHLTA